MAVEKFANLPGPTTLASSYTSGGSSIEVTSATGFPTTGVFRVRLGNAGKTIYRVDSVSGTTFTGGAEANDANAAGGDAVRIVASRQVAERWIQSPTAGELHAPSGVSGADFYGPLWKLAPLDQSGWSWVNQGGASITQANGIVHFSVPNAAGENIRLRVTSAPATPYTFATFVRPNVIHTLSEDGFGIALRESGTGKIISVGVRGLSGGVATHNMVVRKNTDATTFSALPVDLGTGGANGGFFCRVGADGTNVSFGFSFDGVNWTTLLSETKATFFTTAPDEVGIASMLNTTGQTAGASYLSWVQT